METKHTPGQWEISKTINDYAIYSDNNPQKDIALAYQYSRGISKEEAEANAALISAAPNLLRVAVATLEDLEAKRLIGGNESETYWAAIDNLKAAIAKATQQ